MMMIISVFLDSIGASGAVYGLRLFFVVDRFVAIQRYPDRRLFIFMQLVFLALIPSLHTIPIIFILDLKVKIAHSAHFGGGLVGFLCGIGVLGCRTACRRISFVLLALYFIISSTIFYLIDVPIIDFSWYKSGSQTEWNETVSNITLTF